IESADEIEVKLNSGKEFEAEVVGRDPNTDLALIKIKSEQDLPIVKLGDSDELKVGEWVVAIGSPFGLEHTVTAGIVSAKGRVIGSGPYDDFIQTDASINPGNSGGPLLNLKGEVVGINTAIVASAQGIGFAVPVNLAKNVIEQLKTKGEVTRGWLGVGIQDISEEMSEYYGLKNRKGAMVAEVFEGDPADKAGIKTGDVIVEVNGEKIESSRDLTHIIAGITVGDTIKIEVMRSGKPKTFKVEIAKREEARLASPETPKEQEETLGIRVSNITPEIAHRYNLFETDGVVVVDVASGSIAAEGGVQRGDVIKEINHQTVKTLDDYTAIIKRIEKGEAIQLFIRRANMGFLVIKLIK
ncbi:Do family serine endopeptidase, partial [Thermodesulfobacteriota bacterium]